MTTTAQDRTTAIGPMLQSVRRHARLALVVALVVFVVTAVAVMAYPVKSKATATVQLYPVAGGLSTTNNVPVNVSTEARTGSSDVVLNKASERLGGSPSAGELSRQLEVDAPDGSQNLMFTVQGASGTASAERANAVAQAYLDHTKAHAQGIVKAGSDRLSALIAKSKSNPELAKNVAQLELALAQQQQVNVEPGQLVDPAQASARSWMPTVIVAVFAGLFLGLMAGFATVLLRDRTAKNAIDASRLAAVSGHEVLDWDGDMEGVRRLMDRLARTRPGVPAVIITGSTLASPSLLQSMASVEGERQRNPDVAVIDDAQVIDTGQATMELLEAVETTSVLRHVSPELGMSRFVRLADVAVPVLVADAQTPVAEFLEAVDQVIDARYGVEIVFAEKPRPSGGRRSNVVPASAAAPAAVAPAAVAPSASAPAATAPIEAAPISPLPAPGQDTSGLAASVSAAEAFGPAGRAGEPVQAASDLESEEESARARAARHAAPQQGGAAPKRRTLRSTARPALQLTPAQAAEEARLQALGSGEVEQAENTVIVQRQSGPAPEGASTPSAAAEQTGRPRGNNRGKRQGWKGATSR